MKQWKVKAYLPGGMGMPSYNGECKARGETEAEAIENAKVKIRRIHGNREIRVNHVHELHNDWG